MKHCLGCDKTKPETDFAFRNKAKGLRQPRCRQCRALYDSQAYQDQPQRREVVKAAVSRHATTKLVYIREALGAGCTDCGNKDIRVLEFDHLEDSEKVDGVGRLARQGASLDRIKAEIEKCEIVCRNCHAIRTHTRAGWTWGLPMDDRAQVLIV